MTLRDKMFAVMDDVNGEVAEREELVQAISIALLTGKNLFILGDTGQAKSFAINQFRKRITGAVQFERLISKQTDEEQLFGRLDLPALIGGTSRLITTGKIPESHIVFLDEIYKANDGILNALLTALNERRFTNEGQVIDIPVVSFFSASNEIPNFNDPEEKILKPLYDRFELKLVTEYVANRESRLNVLRHKQAGHHGAVTASITLDELYAMQREVAAVKIPDTMNELMDDILCTLREKKILISDRKYFGYYPLAQAMAWLDGRDTVASADLKILSCYLWTTPDERAVIDPVLELKCTDPLREKLDSMRELALEVYKEFEDSADADPIRRIGKLRNELVRLHEGALALCKPEYGDAENGRIDALLCDLDVYNKRAHEVAGREYVSLSSLLEIRAAS